VRIVFKDFPLPSHKLAPLAHEAARCAGALGQYWPYHDRLFTHQPEFDRADLVRYAVEVGVPRDAFVACLDAHRFARPSTRTSPRPARSACAPRRRFSSTAGR
jgi:hypothetical protein